MKKADDNKFLKKMLVDSGLDNILSNTLKIHGQIFLIRKGDGFHLLNGQAEYLYFLVEGKIKISSLCKESKTTETRLMNPVCLIGDLDLFSTNSEIINFNALMDSVLIGFRKEHISIYDYNNPIFMRFTINNPKDTSIQNSESILRQDNLPLRKRLLCYLHSRWCETNQFQFPIDSREYLGKSMNVSPRYIGRILREFEDAGIIKVTRSSVTITNLQELSSIVNEEDNNDCS